jgi:hypothetical protein
MQAKLEPQAGASLADDPRTMGIQVAYRTSVLAGARAQALAEDTEAMVDTLREGDVIPALDALEAAADRLQRFLTFLVITSEILFSREPAVGARLVAYNQRLVTLLEKVDDALTQYDLARVGLVLAHGLAPALRDYEDHADDVIAALAPACAAA